MARTRHRRPAEHPPTLPAAFLERIRADLGAEDAEGADGADGADALVASLAGAPARALRANPAKVDLGALAGRLGVGVDPVAWCPTATHLDAAARLGQAPELAAGLGYLQEPSALAVVEALGIRPGHRVADLAASPGGKSTHALGALAGAGLLVANERSGSRVGSLAGNVERWGTAEAVVTSAAVADLAAAAPGVFDRVILDAPCSGEAMWRKDPLSVRQWSPTMVAGNARRQADLLEQAAVMVAPGGRLAYSTCTFGRSENEDQIAAFLDRHPGWSPVDLSFLHGAEPALGGGIGVRLWPHRAPVDGHYLAVLTAPADEPPPPPTTGPPSGRRPPAEVLAQLGRLELATVDRLPRDGLVLHGEVVYLPPALDVPELPGIRRSGLPVAQLATGRVEPTHALALATLDPGPDLEALDPDELAAFRRGVPLERAGPPGWRLVGMDRWPIGWGYRADGRLKPRLPRHERLPSSPPRRSG